MVNFKSRVWASNPPHMFVISALWLTTTYHCNVMSTTSHEHASITCVNYVSSAVRSPLIQLILLCVHSYTVNLTTVMEFLLVCTNISTTDFNLSSELPLDSFRNFQNGPAFPRPCETNPTGSLIQKGSISNYVAPSTSVCTTAHRSTWLNYAYRSPRSRDIVICDRLHMATSSYRWRLPRLLALVDFYVLAQWPGTVCSLFLRTHLYPLQCLKNCWKQNCLTEIRSQLHAPLWRFV